MMRALALAVLLARPAAACHDCDVVLSQHLGVAEDGTWAVTSEGGTSETDYRAIWHLAVGRGTTELCRLIVSVDEQDHIDLMGKRPRLCERASGLAGGTSQPHRERALVEQRIIATLGLTPVERVPAPPVTLQHDAEYRSLRFTVKLDRRTLGAVVLDLFNEERFFGGTWAVSAYAHPRFDGVFLRLMTLMPMRENEWHSGGDCLSGRDVFLAVKP